jgi:hypothetical protein
VSAMARQAKTSPSGLPWLRADGVEGAWRLFCLDHMHRVVMEGQAADFVRSAKGGVTVTMPAPGT